MCSIPLSDEHIHELGKSENISVYTTEVQLIILRSKVTELEAKIAELKRNIERIKP